MEATTADAPPSGARPSPPGWIATSTSPRRGSSIPTEVRGGAATFLTMAYILFVNPQILGSVAAPGGVKLPFDQLLTVTALVAAVATLAMGIYGRYPFALAAGLGHQRLRGLLARRRRPPELARRDGGRRRRGPRHHGAGPGRLPRGGHQRDPPRPQARHRDRDRPLHHDHRAGRRRHRRQGRGHRRHDRPEAQHVGDRDLRHRPVRDLRDGRAAGPRRAAVRDPRHHAPRDDHQRGQGQEGLPQRLGHVARQDLRRAGLRPRRRTSRCTSSRRSASGARWPSWSSVLLSDFFDTAGTVLGLGRRAELVDARRPAARACAAC